MGVRGIETAINYNDTNKVRGGKKATSYCVSLTNKSAETTLV